MNTATDGNNETECGKPRRAQFSIRHVLLVFVALGVLLALATQFRHVGVAAFCFLAVVVAGWWRRNWRLTSAGLTALCTFVITYAAFWTQSGRAFFMHLTPQLSTWERFLVAEEALSQYRLQEGDYPQFLTQLPNTELQIYFDESGSLPDGWGHPFHYAKTADGFELISRGRDGEVGGVGLDADATSAEDLQNRAGRLPLKQFLFETDGSASVFWTALLISLSASTIWRGEQSEHTPSACVQIIGVLATTIAAVLVATFLAIFHVAASQSGH